LPNRVAILAVEFSVTANYIQMPFLDGMAATRKIRQFEKENSPILSQNITSYSRIPIIAVSASLSESALKIYIESGFDGWILKPINFARLEV
jgi:CheY-like chemotaxis protein